ncbi:MAG TPA: HAD hydrolase family protein [Vicinamibacterales bacterium]|jgi:hydroxymethylpyrimidine pyrophosphatase-like HAD family hydrolase
MKLFALALDYDGTIAFDDTVDPLIRDAIAAARTSGITVLLVTGRILDELRQVAGSLHFVDAVIAENGAVLHLPASNHTTLLGAALPAAFVTALRQRGISFRAGHSLIDADADDAPQLLQIIRNLELPLVLAFNKGRVMTTVQGLSKGTGLHAALDTMRLSARNTLAIGDAENDHELLRLAEVGVAVPWASASLRAVADAVMPGDGAAAVASYVRALAASGQLPEARLRRKLLLGYAEDGEELWLTARGRNVLIAGDTRSGKSWVAGLLAEQLILHGYSVCVLDPEGDYRSLEALPGVTLLGGDEPPPTPRQLERALRYPDRSAVIDLSRLSQDDKISYIRAALPALNAMRRHLGLPHRIVVDEAHYFLHEPHGAPLLDLERSGYTVVTYCASKLPRSLLDATEVIIVTCESNPAELAALRRCAGSAATTECAEYEALRHLRPGQAATLPGTKESGGHIRLFNVASRLTPHVRHRQKYVDVPVSDARAFVFEGAGPKRRARTLREFVAHVEGAPWQQLDGHVQRGDFSRWIKDVFGDHALAADLRFIEARHRSSPGGETIAQLADAVRSRYELPEESLSAAS